MLKKGALIWKKNWIEFDLSKILRLTWNLSGVIVRNVNLRIINWGLKVDSIKERAML